MATKKKTVQLQEISNFEEANQVLGEIGRLEIELSLIDSETSAQINRIKEEAILKGKPYREKIEHLEASLIAFGDSHKSEICAGGKRSVDLAFGTIGFRISTKLTITKDKTLALLKSLFPGKGIHVKESEDKEELAKWPVEDLAAIAARRSTEDTFYMNVDEEAVNASLRKAV